ncbi:MAG: fructose-bisphosphate aldolase class I [Planctomycetes bacterium]|nr:fructose-bisphosphate aldolase class I [Planctomycetota bacterium]
MNSQALIDTAAALVADDKGLLAMDESTPTCNKRFAVYGIPQNEDYRRAYRELLITTPGLSTYISGAILYDETILQNTQDGTSMITALTAAGIIPGIKVDTGAPALAGHPGEQVSAGLDGLRERLADYARLGARFAKWRAKFVVKADLPSHGCIEANAHALARYAALSQEAGMVPIVEPEVLMDGDHSLARCRTVTETVQHAVFAQLRSQRVLLEGIILKPNMVLPGTDSAESVTTDMIAEATIGALLRTVPAAVAGVAFLSGGQTPERATVRLNAMHVRYAACLPWALTFSFSRALQQPVLEIWRGAADNAQAAQRALLQRALCNHAARRGTYVSTTEPS